MSKLTDYSKFDHLTEDSDDESNNAEKNDHASHEMTKTPPQRNNESNKNDGGAIRRDESSGLFRFEYRGSTRYKFEQTLDDVTIYVLAPDGVTKGRQINCIISAKHLKLGKVVNEGGSNGSNCQWYLNEGTYGTVDVDESTWTLEDYDGADDANDSNKNERKIIVISLAKANRGTVWEAALRGHKTNASGSFPTMDPICKEQVKADLMKQRFDEENPGYDFSGADFNGSIPDARDFMGGIKYQ